MSNMGNKTSLFVLTVFLVIAAILTWTTTKLDYNHIHTISLAIMSGDKGKSSNSNQSHFMTVPFEQDKIGCVIKRLNRTEWDAYSHNLPRHNRTCTLTYFQEFFRENKQFYGHGARNRDAVEYAPRDCVFTDFTQNVEHFSKCLERKNISRILLTGDSTARCMFPTFMAFFEGWKCTKIKTMQEPGGIGIGYFMVPGVPMNNIFSTFTSVDHSWMYKCVSEEMRIVYLEYISMTRLVDIGLLLKKQLHVPPYNEATHKLEYLLRYYLPYYGFPDLWLFKFPFRHETWTRPTSKTYIDIQYTLQQLKLYVPRTSKLIFLVDSRDCAPQEYKEWRNKGLNVSRNYMLHFANQAFYDIFSDMTYSLPNMYAFLDDMRLSCSMMCDHHRDGIHYTDAYYSILSRYVLESVCADDILH